LNDKKLNNLIDIRQKENYRFSIKDRGLGGGKFTDVTAERKKLRKEMNINMDMFYKTNNEMILERK
tara:strand:+ start:450 stop:647 length:198 start_codon:yes stop_codon:yes gene_type:complete